MSYLVLARKWRPKNFAEMVGQEHVLRALTNALDSERLHHAYLFAGTRGVGKTTIARIFAKALNCETGMTSQPCGKCSACLEIDEGRFVDLIEVDAASKTKVDDTRDLLDNVQYAPARGRFKVYLIDEVHMLSKSSFNALLKTLEEPPPHVKFLLATTDPQKLPITVLSRCLQFNLKRLTPKLIRDRLWRSPCRTSMPKHVVCAVAASPSSTTNRPSVQSSAPLAQVVWISEDPEPPPPIRSEPATCQTSPRSPYFASNSKDRVKDVDSRSERSTSTLSRPANVMSVMVAR